MTDKIFVVLVANDLATLAEGVATYEARVTKVVWLHSELGRSVNNQEL
jgi:hypothetical protein